MIVRERAATMLVDPQDLRRREGNNQAIAQRSRFAEKLQVAGVENVVTAGNKNARHGLIKNADAQAFRQPYVAYARTHPVFEWSRRGHK